MSPSAGCRSALSPKDTPRSDRAAKRSSTDPPDPSAMEQKQLLHVLLLCLMALHRCLAMPLSSQCVDESFCTYSLQDYYSQLVNMPARINERSIATWSYVENIDLNRVPQVIHEASCHSGRSCRGLDNSFGLETIPVSLRMPVLKKNPTCFPSASYSLEFELITVACICAISRHN